ncbi:MAG: hypothetical protein AAF741_06185 [Bacteroidota bacterium]
MNSEYDDIKDGFNAGYVLRKHEPDLAEQLAESYKNVDGDYFKAFISGTEEYARELKLERDKQYPGLDNHRPGLLNEKNREKNGPEFDLDR